MPAMAVIIFAGVARSYNANGVFEIFSPRIDGDKFRPDTSYFLYGKTGFSRSNLPGEL